MLSPEFLAEVDGWMAAADTQAALFPGEPASPQPVHTAYVPADRVAPDTPQRWGERASALLEQHAPDPDRLATVTGLTPGLAAQVHPRVRRRLAERPVDDLRVDFEDGYGARPDAEEDAAATAAGRSLAAVAATSGSPLVCGLRIKGLQAATRRRGLRTLDLVLAAARAAPEGLPARFVVTLPKVAHVDEVTAAVRIVERLEHAHALPDASIRIELQVELPQAVVGPDGAATVARLVHAAAGRCEGLHYGTYDFSAAAGVVAGEQSLEHPLADHAKAVMQLAAAQTGVRVSDGSTNVLPEGDGPAVAAAWALHARLVRRSLRRALYQGWDLHPGQLVTRYAATFGFYREQLPASAARLARYLAGSPSGILDEPATARALAGALVRALDCGACDDAEVTAATGLDHAALLALAGRH